MRIKTLSWLLLSFAFISLHAQKDGGKKKKKKPATPASAPTEVPKPKDEKPSINSKTKNCKKIPGLFTLYQDTTNGKLYMVVNKVQLGKEYIHFTYTENGVLEAGHNRGQYRGSRIFAVKKVFDNLEFELQNTSFFFDSANEISKSAEANISNSILAFEKIVGFDEKNGDYLIDADEIFLSEKLHPVKTPSFPGDPFSFNLGMLSKSKTRYGKIRNYPENTDLLVKYVFDNPAPLNGGGEAVADARNVSILLQHSFLAMPKNNFKPRRDDARIGYFSEQSSDMTSKEAINYRDFIHRWNLEKKDPTAEKSEPVKPIVWWIENTTPKEFRPIIKAAALTWNKAFEPLGFVNAVQVFEQPDSATWDAGDIRYNVLRWTSSPNPPFGGYGPSFVNPRTGEILGADIMLEYIFVTNRIIAEKLFDVKGSEHTCMAGHHLHNECITGMHMLKAAGAEEVEITELIRQSLYYLILHEMGHTFGLMHNMKASQLHSPAELKDMSITENTGLIGSVMDYPAINFGPSGEKTHFAQSSPGPYDMWAIEYGYSVGLPDATEEEKRLQKILSRSAEPQLTFGNDADDMRSPGKGIDPRVNVNDMSNDAILFATQRMDRILELMGNIKSRYVVNGENYQELKMAYNGLSNGYTQMAGIIARYVGGVYVERNAAGTGNKAPFTPVSLADQKRAMNALNKYVFAPDAFKIPEGLIEYLQTQRRGFNFFGTGEDPKTVFTSASLQNAALDHILSASVLMRLTESKAYGNQYSVTDVFSDLTKAIFDADLAGNVNAKRQLLQINYVQRLIAIAGIKDKSRFDEISKARATAVLLELQSKLKSAIAGDADTKAHRKYLLLLIENGLDD